MNQDYGDQFDEYDQIKTEDLAKRFETILARKEHPFFAEEVFEQISTYYLQIHNQDLGMKACYYGLKHYPHSLDLLLNKTQFLIDQLAIEEATETLEQAQLYHPGDVEIEYYHGILHMCAGEFDAAIEKFKSIEDIFEDTDNLYFQLGLAYSGHDRNPEALSYFQKAAEMGSQNELLYLELIFTYEITETIEQGIKYFNELIEKDPYNYLAWYGLGLLKSNVDYEESVYALDYAVTINEKFGTGWFNLGCTHMNNSNWEKAKDAFIMTVDLQPDSDSYTHLGSAYEKLEEYPLAFKYYKMASEIDEYWDDAWYGLSSVLYEQEKFLESIHFIKKAIKINDTEADYYLMLGDNEAKLGNIVAANEAYEQAVELDPINPDIWLNWSLMFFETRQYARAVEIIQEGIEELPEEADFYYRGTIYLMFAQRLKESYNYLQEALILDYDKHEQLYDFLSNLETLKALQKIIEQFRAYNNENPRKK